MTSDIHCCFVRIRMNHNQSLVSQTVLGQNLLIILFASVYLMAMRYKEPLPEWDSDPANNAATRFLPWTNLYTLFLSIPFHQSLWQFVTRRLPTKYQDRDLARMVAALGFVGMFFLNALLGIHVASRRFAPNWVEDQIMVCTGCLLLLSASYVVLSLMWSLEITRAAPPLPGGATLRF